MSETSSDKQSSKSQNKGKRKVKDKKNENNINFYDKKIRQDGTSKPFKPEELQVVPFNKNSDGTSSSDEEEVKHQIIPFATDISSNPLSTYNTFVCHLGDWKDYLKGYLSHPQFRNIFSYVQNEYDMGRCFPPQNLIFNAFQKTPFSKLKVVMLGQAPSVKLNEAMGLSYSMPKGMRVTPIIDNIYKALVKDPKVTFSPPHPVHGDLKNWADQGILMLNNSLTVREGKTGSHSQAGWKNFTKAVLKSINKDKEGVIFL